MDTVVTRKQGNAVTVTLDSKYGVSAGKVYYVSKEEDGTISFIPKIEDYFVSAKKNELVDKEDELATNFSVESKSFDG